MRLCEWEIRGRGLCFYVQGGLSEAGLAIDRRCVSLNNLESMKIWDRLYLNLLEAPQINSVVLMFQGK